METIKILQTYTNAALLLAVIVTNVLVALQFSLFEAFSEVQYATKRNKRHDR